MKERITKILTINGGSSSIKFALFNSSNSLTELLYGELKNIGSENSIFSFNNIATGEKNSIPVKTSTHTEASTVLIDFLNEQNSYATLIAIGHRIVHGMQHTEPEVITPELLDELKKISAYDPEHLTEEIKLIELFNQHYPAVKQVACFDTAFHTCEYPCRNICGE